MKKLSYLIIIVLVSSLVLAGCSLLSNISHVPATGQSGITYLTKGLVTGLVGLWHFDEGNGTIANDSSGNGNDGTLKPTGSEPTWVSGMFGKALSFDGVNGYVSVPDSTSLDLSGEITVEAWIKVAVHKNYNAIVIKGEDCAENYELLLTSTGLLYSTIKFTDGTRCYPYVSGAILDTEWHYVAMTYKPGEWRIYVDGVKKAEINGISKTPLTNDIPLLIGAEKSGGSFMSGRFFNGLIDQVRIWDRALTESDIEYNYSIESSYSSGNVKIDIKPGSDPNSINLDSNGVVPVAILGSEDFDAAEVNPLTVALSGAAAKLKGNSGNAGSLEDVDDDGYLDRVVQVYTEQLVLTSGDTVAVLNAYTYAGLALTGSDWIRIVPPK